MIRFTLQFIANMIIKRMEAIADRKDKLANDEFHQLYTIGMELVMFSLMTFAIELD